MSPEQEQNGQASTNDSVGEELLNAERNAMCKANYEYSIAKTEESAMFNLESEYKKQQVVSKKAWIDSGAAHKGWVEAKAKLDAYNSSDGTATVKDLTTTNGV